MKLRNEIFALIVALEIYFSLYLHRYQFSAFLFCLLLTYLAHTIVSELRVIAGPQQAVITEEARKAKVEEHMQTVRSAHERVLQEQILFGRSLECLSTEAQVIASGGAGILSKVPFTVEEVKGDTFPFTSQPHPSAFIIRPEPVNE